MLIRFALGLIIALITLAATDRPAHAEHHPRLLVFTQTLGWRHESIEAGVEALRKLGEKHGFSIEHTEDPSTFDNKTLAGYQAIVFLSSTTNQPGNGPTEHFNDTQKAALTSFVRGGGGIVGIHGAADSNYTWPWFGKMMGGYFLSHPNNPNVRDADLTVVDGNHPSTKMLPKTFSRSDEWYDFQDFNTDVTVVLTVDEESYGGGKMGNPHPISWYHAYDGGRVFYTAMGHTIESFSEPLFLDHLAGGIAYALDRDGHQ